MSSMPASTALPLSGVRIIDLSRLVAGNLLTVQLADFGADVIKVEPIDGDTLRNWREKTADGAGWDGWWRTYGRNKRSLALNFRDRPALDALKALVASADVLIESFRPGTLEAMGLAPEKLHAIRPALIIVRISGWGQTGPYRELPGFGSLIEGFSGFAYKHTEAERPRLPNMALADMTAGLTGAFATMAALRQVEVNGGRGQVIDLSLLEPMLAVMGPDVGNVVATGRLPPPNEKIASPRGAYKCKDGLWVAMSGSTDAMAKRVMEAIGKRELVNDPRFATNKARLENDEELDALIEMFIGTLDRDQCLALFRSKGVTVGPIYDARQLLQDEHVRERGCYVSIGDPPTVMHAVTPRLSETPGAILRGAPALGEHTREILREVGLTDFELTELQEKGSIKCS